MLVGSTDRSIGLFERFAFVVQSSTLRPMLILFADLEWKSKQADFEIPFLHASLDDVYVETTSGFHQPEKS